MIARYFRRLQSLLRQIPLAQPPQVTYDRRDDEIGFVRGDLLFMDGSLLHFREYVRLQTGKPPDRYMYVYHYQNSSGKLIFRYDNAEHFLQLPSAPHHKHLGETDVCASSAPDLQQVLSEISKYLSTD